MKRIAKEANIAVTIAVIMAAADILKVGKRKTEEINMIEKEVIIRTPTVVAATEVTVVTIEVTKAMMIIVTSTIDVKNEDAIKESKIIKITAMLD